MGSINQELIFLKNIWGVQGMYNYFAIYFDSTYTCLRNSVLKIKTIQSGHREKHSQ